MGVGDAASFGLTEYIRSTDFYGPSYINKCSPLYVPGRALGHIASAIALSGISAESNVAKFLSRSSIWKSAPANWIRKNVFRWGVSKFKMAKRSVPIFKWLHFHLPPSIKKNAAHLPWEYKKYWNIFVKNVRGYL